MPSYLKIREQNKQFKVLTFQVYLLLIKYINSSNSKDAFIFCAISKASNLLIQNGGIYASISNQ